MNTLDTFRIDLRARMTAEKKSQLALAHDVGIEQASLSRFLRGRGGLSGESILRLHPYVYGPRFSTSSLAPLTDEPSHAPEA